MYCTKHCIIFCAVLHTISQGIFTCFNTVNFEYPKYNINMSLTHNMLTYRGSRIIMLLDNVIGCCPLSFPILWLLCHLLVLFNFNITEL